MELHPLASGFSKAAEQYERGRPSYPDEAVAWLAGRLRIGPGRAVLDLAAGTGKLTRLLVPLEARVVAVEPIAEMRAQLEAAVSGVTAVEGVAEAIPLADASVDAVVCAQAFHWFRPQEALREMWRVLRPGGAAAIVRNVRDEADALQARVSEVLEPYRDSPVHFGRDTLGETLARSGLFGPVEDVSFPYSQLLSRDELRARFASVSFVASMPPPQREAVLDRILEAAADRAEPIRIGYRTEIFAFDRR